MWFLSSLSYNYVFAWLICKHWYYHMSKIKRHFVKLYFSSPGTPCREILTDLSVSRFVRFLSVFWLSSSVNSLPFRVTTRRNIHTAPRISCAVLNPFCKLFRTWLNAGPAAFINTQNWTDFVSLSSVDVQFNKIFCCHNDSVKKSMITQQWML